MHGPILSYGEILYDIFPSYQRPGGAPLNFACHMHAFGLPCSMISRVGDDLNGHKILEFLARTMGAGPVQIDGTHETGKVQVRVNDKGIPDFDIVEDAAYDFIEYSEPVERILDQDPLLIYFGTLAQRNPVSRTTLEKILSRRGSAKILYDMNLRQNHFSREIVERSLKRCNILKLNDDELETCKSLFQKSESHESFVQYLMDRFGLEWCSLTRGADGSELFHESERHITDKAPQQTVVDTVGAGDAYAAILALGILNQWDPETILRRATEFSAAVCGIQGAIPEDPRFYEPYRPWTKEGEE